MDNALGLFLTILFLLAERNCFTSAQDYTRLTQEELQTFYKRQSTPRPNTPRNINGMISSRNNHMTESFTNNVVNSYLAVSPPMTQRIPLAIPLKLGETVRKDKLNHTRNHTENTAKIIRDFQKAQRWRFKLIKGTEKHLEDIFVGRCWDYQNRFKLQLKKPVDCHELLEAFLAGFSFKEPCDVTLDDYGDFFAMIHEGPLVNTSMLWSGSREITHELSNLNSRFTALEDTFSGYLLDGMQWCGMIEEPGVNYRHCPYECAKQKAFWGAAAKKMAERSEGIVYAVMNGTRQHWKDKQIFSAYMMDSYMARNQIPNLNPKKVKEVRIMVGHSLHHKVLERCGAFSVKELQRQIESRGINVTCIDDPLSIRALLCLDYPKDALCQFHLTALLSE